MIYPKSDNKQELINDGIYLVDFYAEWCSPCKQLEPIIEEISKEYNVIKVDVDKYKKITLDYRIMSIPTLIIFKNGQVFKELVGFQDKGTILEVLKEANN